MIVDKPVHLVADALYTVLTDASLHQVAPILASISSMLADNADKYDVADTINQCVGQTDDQQTRQLLVDIHTHFEQRIYESEIARLYERFVQDREAGWAEWLRLFAQAMLDWRLRLLKMLSEATFPFPEQRAEDITQIRRLTRYWLIERFEDSYDLPLYFAQQSDLSNAQRARMLVYAAEIQIYRFSRLVEGKKILEQAETLVPQEYMVKCGWGLYWLHQKEYKKAQESLQEAIRLQPQSMDAYNRMGEYYETQEDFEAAEEWYREATKRKAGSSDSDAYIRLLRLYGCTEELFKAHEADLQPLLERAIAVNPLVCYRAYQVMAFVYQQNKRYEDAYSWCERAISLDETRVDAYVQLGFIYVEEGKYQEAYDVLQKALTVAPELFNGYWGMANLCTQQGRWADAAQWYERSLSYRPVWEGILREKIGEMQWKLQHYTEAENQLFKALNYETEEQSIQNIIHALEVYAEEYYKTLEKPDAARRIYEEIHRVRGVPYEASYQNRLGNLEYYAGNYQGAAEYYRKAMAADPNYPIYPSNLAYALDHLSASSREGGRLKTLEDARAALQDALKLSPKDSEYVQRIEKIELKQRLVKKSGEFILGLSAAPFSIRGELGSTLVQPFLNANGVPPDIQALLDALRARFLERYGVRTPGVVFRANRNLSSGGYTFRISGLPPIIGEVPEGKRFFPGSLHNLAALSIHTGEEGHEPLIGMKGYWLAREDWQSVEAAGLPLWQKMEYPLRHLEAVLQGIDVTLIDHLRTTTLLEKDGTEAAKRIANTPGNLRRFVQALKALASESIPFASAVGQLTQAFLDGCETETDPTTLVEQLRRLPALQSTLPGNNAQYSFYQPGQHLEQELTRSIVKAGDTSVLIMEAARYQVFLDEVARRIDAQQQVALLVADAQLRPFVRVLLDPKFPHVPVLSLDEVSPELRERGAGEIEILHISEGNGTTRVQDGRSSGARGVAGEFALSAEGQQSEIDENSIEDDIVSRSIVEIEVFLHPLWYSAIVTQGNSTNTTQSQVQVEQEIKKKLEKLQDELFQEQGLLLPAVHFERDESLKVYEVHFRMNTPRQSYDNAIQVDEWANQSPEQLVTEVGLYRLVEEVFSGLRVLCMEMGGLFLCMDDVQFGLNLLCELYSSLVESTLQRFSLPMLTQTLKEILNAKGAIRDLRTILEVLVTIDGTIPIDAGRQLPVYSGITAPDALNEGNILVFLPRTARCYPTTEGKSLKSLDATDYARYVQMVLKQTLPLKGS